MLLGRGRIGKRSFFFLALFFVRGGSDGRKRDLYKDAFAPQPTRKPLKAWDRAPVAAHAPRLQGQKIWKKRGGLRARGEGEEGQGYNDAVVELEKEGVGARKKARVVGAAAKENISAARWQDVKSKDEEDDAMMGASMMRMSPRKMQLGSPDKLKVVPRKRTNANLVITPRKPLRQMMLNGQGQNTGVSVEGGSPKGKGVGASPGRRRKSLRKGVSGEGEGVKEEVGKRRTSVAVPEKVVGSPKKGELEGTVKRQSLRRSTRGRGSGQGVAQPIQEETVIKQVAEEQPVALPDEQQVSQDSQPKEPTPEPSLTGASDHEKVASSLPFTAPEVTQSEAGAAESVQPQHDVSTVQRSQSTAKEVAIEDEFALKPITSAKQKRSSLRKSTRQSDRLRGSSGSIDRLSELQPSESVEDNASTISTVEAKLESAQEVAAPAATIDKELDNTLTFTIDFDLGQEMTNESPLADVAAGADMATPVQEVNHIMQEPLAHPISPTKLSDEEKSYGYAGSHVNDGEMPESPFAHVSDAEDSDEDIDDEMSELSEILLEPTINVDSLGLAGLKSHSELEMEDDQESDEADAMEDCESLEPVTVADLNVSALLSNSATTEEANETSAQLTTHSELPKITSSATGSSSYMTDDTNLLREFLTRVKADKAAKAAAPPKRRSLPHSPLRIPLGDNIDIEPSSPIQEPEHELASTKDEFNLSTPVPSSSSPTRKRKTKPTPLPSSLTTLEPQSSTRRSGRTRLPVSKVPLPAPSFIPVRRLGGQDGDTQVALKRSADKELAALTRVNTRKNKAGAVSAAEVLARKMEEREDPVLRQRYLREVFEERIRRERKLKEGGEEGAKGRKSVMWKEEIAEYKVMETRKVKTMESRKVDGDAEGEGEKAGKKVKKGEGKEVKDKEKKNRVKVDVGVRTSKIALSVPANGTPVAKKKRAART
ncbi:hypothetical protein CJF31_00003963 [Rutstroemia sp. NJR-2017a BVV2]|nr:hypothetical protein CJF31_00003963 [Rutstroemia sp. NJR-2017a BVV2]